VTVPQEPIYSIGALAGMVGVSPSTLRSWEERYGAIVPQRSAGGQRIYSRDHLEQLRFVCRQMEIGLSAADAHRALADRLAHDPRLTARDRDAPVERRILLVERDPYAAELAEYFLRTEGYDVFVTRSVPEAERIIGEQHIDLAIVDLMIGGGAGLQLCERLKGNVRVLAVSAFDQRARALAVGVDAFVRKPFDSLSLVSAARDLVGTSAIVRDVHPAPTP
jgi:DNA-binding transcriptional MerR regulator